MSFDIFYQPCRYGGKPVKIENRFTGKVVSQIPNAPLTAAELRAVQGILKKTKAQGPDEFGSYSISLRDGGEAEVNGTDLASGCMVAVRGMTSDLIQFLYDLLKAGNWVMRPVMEESATITTAPDCIKGMPADFPKLAVCNSPEELGVLLTDGLQAWEKHRDQVVKGRK
jgi:hypothetical protein